MTNSPTTREPLPAADMAAIYEQYWALIGAGIWTTAPIDRTKFPITVDFSLEVRLSEDDTNIFHATEAIALLHQLQRAFGQSPNSRIVPGVEPRTVTGLTVVNHALQARSVLEVLQYRSIATPIGPILPSNKWCQITLREELRFREGKITRHATTPEPWNGFLNVAQR